MKQTLGAKRSQKPLKETTTEFLGKRQGPFSGFFALLRMVILRLNFEHLSWPGRRWVRDLLSIFFVLFLGGAAMAENQNLKSTEQKFTKPPMEDLKKKLTPEQFEVTQKSGTEQPFQNKYWDNKEEGIYVDVVSGEPLFSSKDKYDSGTGWPSFTQPIDKSSILTQPDYKMGVERTEIRSKGADSHLGHVFNDGPGPTGERYCTNSASLRFIPKDKLVLEGYGEYLKLFEE